MAKTIKNRNLPNQLTIARILAIPVFIAVLLLGYRVAACIIFITAALTDYLDGSIARKYNLVTNFGKLMDPLADKLLTMSAFICLVELGDIPGTDGNCDSRQRVYCNRNETGCRCRGYRYCRRMVGQNQNRLSDGGHSSYYAGKLAFQSAVFPITGGSGYALGGTGYDHMVRCGIYNKEQAGVLNEGQGSKMKDKGEI